MTIREQHIAEINNLKDQLVNLDYGSDYFAVSGKLALYEEQLYWYDKIMGGNE